jgi:hypothetical protein
MWVYKTQAVRDKNLIVKKSIHFFFPVREIVNDAISPNLPHHTYLSSWFHFWIIFLDFLFHLFVVIFVRFFCWFSHYLWFFLIVLVYKLKISQTKQLYIQRADVKFIHIIAKLFNTSTWRLEHGRIIWSYNIKAIK